MKTLPQINSNCIAGKSCVNFEDLAKFETEMLSMFHNLLDKKISLEQFYKDLKEGKHFKQEDLAMHEKAMLIAYNGVKISIQTFILWTALGILFEHIVKDGKSLTDQVGRAFIIQSFVAVAFEMADGNHKGLTRFIPSYLENEKMSYLLLNAGEVQKLANFIEKEGSKFAKEFAKQLGDSAHYINLTGAYNEDDYRVIKGLKTLRRFAFNFLNQLEKMPKYNASREYHQIKHDKKFEHLAKFEVFSKKCANYGGSFLINTAIPNFIEDGTAGIFERLLPDDVFGASYGAVLAISLLTGVSDVNKYFVNGANKPSVLGVRKADDFNAESLKQAVKDIALNIKNQLNFAFVRKFLFASLGRTAGRIAFESFVKPKLYTYKKTEDDFGREDVLNSVYEGLRNAIGQQTGKYFTLRLNKKLFIEELPAFFNATTITTLILENLINENAPSDFQITFENLIKTNEFLIEQAMEKSNNLKNIITELEDEIEKSGKFLKGDKLQFLKNYCINFYKAKSDLDDLIKVAREKLKSNRGLENDDTKRILALQIIGTSSKIDEISEEISLVFACTNISKEKAFSKLDNEDILQKLSPIYEMPNKAHQRQNEVLEQFNEEISTEDIASGLNFDFTNLIINLSQKAKISAELLAVILSEKTIEFEEILTDSNAKKVKDAREEINLLKAHLFAMNDIANNFASQKEPSDILRKITILNKSFFCLKERGFDFDVISKDDLIPYKKSKIKFESKVKKTTKETFKDVLNQMKCSIERRTRELENRVNMIEEVCIKEMEESANNSIFLKLAYSIPVLNYFIEKRTIHIDDLNKNKSLLKENGELSLMVNNLLENGEIEEEKICLELEKIAKKDLKISGKHNIQPCAIIQNQGKILTNKNFAL